MIYTGILKNKGKILDGDADALAYAFEKCGIEPSEDYRHVDPEFRAMLLEWYFSDDWIVCKDREELNENGFERQRE